MECSRCRRSQLLAEVSLLAIVSAGCVGPARSASPGEAVSPVPSSPTLGRIALSAYPQDPPSPGFDIFVLNDGGSRLVNLTASPARDMYPAWSPDREFIAFCSDQEGPSQILLIRPDGTDLQPLTQAIDDCGNPSWSTPFWSPDGEWIAISSAPGGTYPETPLDIFVIRADGSEVLNLTSHPASESGASWSLDSTRLALTSDRDGNEEIYISTIDGSDLTRLTENPARDGAPAWSPDGTRILFVSDRDGNWEVYAMNADGTGQTRLTSDPGSDLSPAWSPDGLHIAFTSNRNGNTDLYRMNSDGSNQINLTNSPENEYWFAWSPDGGRLALSSCIEECQSSEARWTTSVVRSDGSSRIEILGAAASVSWEP